MKRFAIFLFLLLLVLIVLNYVAAGFINKTVENALLSLSEDPSVEITLSSVSSKPYAASVSIHDFRYSGTDTPGTNSPGMLSAGRLDITLRHSDLLNLAFSRSDNALENIRQYRIHAEGFSFQHDGYPVSITATEAVMTQSGNLHDFLDSAVPGNLPAEGHRFFIELKDPVIQMQETVSLPGFTTSENSLLSNRIDIDIEYVPESQQLTIHQALIENDRNRAEYIGTAIITESAMNPGSYRVEADFLLEAESPDFEIMVPGTGQLFARSMEATLHSVFNVTGQEISTDEYEFRFSAENATFRPSASVEQQLIPMFRMLGIPFQPLAISRIGGEVLLMDTHLEFTLHEVETAFTRIRFNLTSFLQDGELSESPVTSGTLELYDMQSQVVQLVRGLETFMRWQLQWDGNSVSVPVTGTLAQPQLEGITTL